jgi:hypothetical protein
LLLLFDFLTRQRRGLKVVFVLAGEGVNHKQRERRGGERRKRERCDDVM